MRYYRPMNTLTHNHNTAPDVSINLPAALCVGNVACLDTGGVDERSYPDGTIPEQLPLSPVAGKLCAAVGNDPKALCFDDWCSRTGQCASLIIEKGDGTDPDTSDN